MDVDAGQIVVQPGEGLADVGRNADGVRAGLLVDGEADAFHAVDAHQVVDFGIQQGDFGDVRDAHGLAGAGRVVDVAHDDVAHVFHGAEARHAAHLEHPVAVLQGAGRSVHVLRAQALLQKGERDAERIEAVAIHRHAHFLLAPADHPRFGHARQLLQRRRDLAAGQPPQFGKIRLAARRGQAKGQNRRLARVEAAHVDLVHVLVRFDASDGLLHVHQGDVQVHVPVEDHGGHQAPGARHLGDFADAAHGEQHLLDALAVETLHLRGRPVAGAHRHHHGRALQIGQQIDGQFLPGQPAHQGHR